MYMFAERRAFDDMTDYKLRHVYQIKRDIKKSLTKVRLKMSEKNV